MRRLAIVAFGLLGLLAPRPAQAWWEYIEGFSGPRVWQGWDIEVRLACFSKVDPKITRAAERLGRARAFSLALDAWRQQAMALSKDPQADFESWRQLIESRNVEVVEYHDELKTLTDYLRTQLPTDRVREIDEIMAPAAAARAFTIKAASTFTALILAVPLSSREVQLADLSDTQVPAGQREQLTQAFSVAIESLTKASGELLNAAEQLRQKNFHLFQFPALVAGLPIAGLMFTACRVPADHVRQGSIDLGFHFNRSKDDKFADGQRVTLVMFTPSYSWRLSSYIDAGTGGGVYWFSSHGTPPSATPPPAGEIDRSGIAPFSGVMLEPIRFDFHAPRSVTKPLRAFVSGFLFRVGTYWFPAGFESGAFGVERQKPAEVLKRVAVFYDFEPLREYCTNNSRWYCRVIAE